MTGDSNPHVQSPSVAKALAIMIGCLAFGFIVMAVVVIAFGTTAAVVTFSLLAVLIGVAAFTYSKLARRR